MRDAPLGPNKYTKHTLKWAYCSFQLPNRLMNLLQRNTILTKGKEFLLSHLFCESSFIKVTEWLHRGPHEKTSDFGQNTEAGSGENLYQGEQFSTGSFE